MYGIAVGKTGGTDILVGLTGEFDISALEELRGALDAAAYLRGPAVVDLSGITFLDLLCARELAVRSQIHAHKIRLRSPSRPVLDSARACGLEDWLLLAPGTGDREPPVISGAL
ncbi:MAG TPA: STAS domain-containing protein [Rubrobacteraceae bacterium]|nr:STAS domain-containing protein [Rubrobacteraceae bacterium]